MNTTQRNILNLTFLVLSILAIFAFCIMTHSLALHVHVLADEIIPVR